MDRAAFYAHLRKRDGGLFGTSLSQRTVDGMEAILDEIEDAGADLGQAAYILATGYGESGRKMYPVRENMNYSATRLAQVFGAHRRQGHSPQELAHNPELLANVVYGGAWGVKNLGNTEPGDGWAFRGALIGQNTGRRNFEKLSMDLGVDLIGRPELLDELWVAAKALVKPMMEGTATGRGLREFVSGNRRDYMGARQVWNGSFMASEFAGYARDFERALTVAGYTTPEPVPEPTPPEATPEALDPISGHEGPRIPVIDALPPRQTPDGASKGLSWGAVFAGLGRWLVSIFKRS